MAAVVVPDRRGRRRDAGVDPDRLEGGAPPRGLLVVPGFAGPGEQAGLVARIAREVGWSSGSLGGRRMETWLAGHRALPDWGVALGGRLVDLGVFGEAPDYLHLIEYRRGTGIPPHVDADDLGDVVAGLTLGSTRVLELTRPWRRPVRVLLRPGDLYVLAGEARMAWAHAVPAVATDRFRGTTVPRRDGLSATWRRVRPGTPWAEAMRAGPAAG